MRHLNISKTFIPIFLLIMTILYSAVASAGIMTEVVINKSVLINIKKPIERISIVNPAIADMIPISPRQLQVNGITLGSTSLIVWEKGNDKPTFFDINVVPLNHNENSQQVLLQVKVAQVDRTSLRNLGVSFSVKSNSAEGFSNIIGAPTYPGSSAIAGNSGAIGSFNPLDMYTFGISHFPSGTGAVLKALATKNLAKVLAEPNLVVRSGEKGGFLAGSKIPYPIVTSTGGTATSSIVFMDVGVKLNFAPEVMDDGSIRLKIDPAEVSTLSGTLIGGTNGYPIIDTREVRTNVVLRDGECLVMAGLLSEENIKTMSKVPWLGDIPILGALFRSTTDDIKEKELVFFITPKLIKPMAPGTKVDLPTDKKLTPEQEREMQWIPMFK